MSEMQKRYARNMWRVSNEDEDYGSQLICNLCFNKINIMRKRQKSHINLKIVTEKITAASSKKFKDVDIDTTVLVKVPKVDRGPLDRKNVIGKVIQKKKNELYRLSTSCGIINDWIPRNAILPISGTIVSDSIPEIRMCVFLSTNQEIVCIKYLH